MEDRGNRSKDYFLPGDTVVLRQNLPEKPVMIVKGKEVRYMKDSPINHLRGIKCIWFSKNLELQSAIFNTKDLMHYTQ